MPHPKRKTRCAETIFQTCEMSFTSIFERVARAGSSNESHKPVWARNMRPLTLPEPCGRLQSFGGARPWLRLSLGLGPTVLGHTHIPRLQSEGPIGTLFFVGLHVFLVLVQYFRIVVIMRLTILATIVIAPLFVIVLASMAINNCTSPRSRIGTSIIPSLTTIVADPASACFFACYIVSRNPQGPLSPGPLWVRPCLFGFSGFLGQFGLKLGCRAKDINLVHLNVQLHTERSTGPQVGKESSGTYVCQAHWALEIDALIERHTATQGRNERGTRIEGAPPCESAGEWSRLPGHLPVDQ